LATKTPTDTLVTIPTHTSTPTETPTVTLPASEITVPTATIERLPYVAPRGWLMEKIWVGGNEALAIVRVDHLSYYRVLFANSVPIETINNVKWSPDGQWIAFINDYKYLYVMRPDGSGLHHLPTISGEKPLLTWSLDGQYIFYKVNIYNDDHKFLYSTTYKINIATEITVGWPDDETNRIVSPDGGKVALFGPDDSWDFTISIANQNLENVYPIEGLTISGGFSWDPNGQAFVYGTQPAQGCREFFIYNLDERSSVQITDDVADKWAPAWSPDGHWIAYMAYPLCSNHFGQGMEEAFIIRPDGSAVRSLKTVGWVRGWAPLPPLEVGGEYTITESGDNLGLRDAPTLSGTVKKWLKQGAAIDVLEGPVEADEYLWWRVRGVEGGAEGWVNEIPGWFFSEW
jgi:dipeptidyl aminopeptidase/acylaminoacyl peptidase